MPEEKYVEDEEESDDDKKGKGKLEDVRMSNFAYSQTKIAEYLSFYFAMIGVGSSIIASEIYRYNNIKDENKDHIIAQLIICNISTAFLSKLIFLCINANISWFNHCISVFRVIMEESKIVSSLER